MDVRLGSIHQLVNPTDATCLRAHVGQYVEVTEVLDGPTVDEDVRPMYRVRYDGTELVVYADELGEL